jgi:hypothetical protein
MYHYVIVAFDKKIAPMDQHREAAQRRVVRGSMREDGRANLIDSNIRIMWGVLHIFREELWRASNVDVVHRSPKAAAIVNDMKDHILFA